MRPEPGIHIAAPSDVYPPSDDSRLLRDAVVVQQGERFLEIGTGTGFVALHAARSSIAVATEVSPSAALIARENARKNRRYLAVVRTDLASGLRGPFDVVAFNPPYLEGAPSSESEAAWSGGDGGNEVAMRFLDDLPRILAPGSRAYLLLSRANTRARALAEAGFHVRVVASRALFFERLEVLELRRRFAH